MQQHKYPTTAVNQQTKYTKSESSALIELQVNITIGKSKYLLQVEKCSNLHIEVQNFLQQHKLNAKYERPILAMVREELAKRDPQKGSEMEYIDELKRINEQMDCKRKAHANEQHSKEQTQQQAKHLRSYNDERQFRKENKQNKPNNVDEQSKGNEGRQRLRSEKKEEDNQCQSVYQKWKIKEKMKGQQKLTNNTAVNKQCSREKTANKSEVVQVCDETKDKEKSAKKLSAYEADYLYKKGMKFKYAKELHAEELFKEKYPFQLHREYSVTPTGKAELHERLHNEHKVREVRRMQRKIGEKASETKPIKTIKTMDKYKQRVYERDSKVDETLNYFIQNRIIENPYRIEKVCKSPFRKVNL